MNQVIIEKGLIKKTSWMDLLQGIAKKWVIITDDQVKDLWAISLKERCIEHGFEMLLLSVPFGEESKSRAFKEKLEDQMLENGFGKDTGIMALGGGMITDLGGFTAATYCRGIPFISIPTTLMGMVDASIGGKVAVNTPYAKNMIGAFYPPRAVLLDMDMLETLPQKEKLNGLAEIVKYGLIWSPEILIQLQKESLSDDLIAKCCHIKQTIVSKDPYETGLRRILNYGHTIGHALETASSYRMSHGEAVAMGMIVEGYISHQMGFLSSSEQDMLCQLIKEQGFSLEIPKDIQAKDIENCMRMDKKALANCPRFALLESIGRVKDFEGAYCTFVPSEVIFEAINWMFSQFQD